ncbi:protein of unknown function DUF1222 [Cavenderia fasciculata]|uniref:Lipase maturation factor 2 n=1 Tax=Cavenderia fasciculata TaxID=261658 RepID=F4PLA1_CACFS|nr:protein of unknown function DUF1222 [Cavenderia fasciculata]EGG23323.1 protein of unknown function DUF1222 [Cavenderia fasciculata]|eukprot:XP_004361174.1 protein of unknown function DUF1222 [Cavenderia fasciculata]
MMVDKEEEPISSSTTKKEYTTTSSTTSTTKTFEKEIDHHQSNNLSNYYRQSIDYIKSIDHVKLLIWIAYAFALKCTIQYAFIYPYFDYKEYLLVNDYTQWILQRSFAVISFISFYSLKVQVITLLGRNGILPIYSFIKEQSEIKKKGFWSKPSLFYFFSPDSLQDWHLNSLCSIGMILSIFYFMDILPTLNILLLYIIFLSFKNVGREFFQLQFDNLLCEVYVLSLLTPPFRIIPFFPIYTPRFYQITMWALYFWLTVRLFTASGLCKLTSHDPNWRNGTALSYHYWSQPMPMWTSYLFNSLPNFINKLSCYLHFIIEIGSPLLLFESYNHYVAYFNVGALVLLQIMILVSGNYGIFNLLAIQISLSLLQDDCVPNSIKEYLNDKIYINSTAKSSGLIWELAWDSIALGILLFYLSLSYIPLSQLSRNRMNYNNLLIKIYSVVSKFGLMNYYGLFGTMTTTRKEIIFEGSIDGKEWRQYEFKWKPGDLDRKPRFIIGHLPRLEWRLWFCQFQVAPSFRGEQWLDSLLEKMLLNEEDTVSVFLRNPFQSEPPKFMRCLLVPYKFSKNTPIDQFFNRVKSYLLPQLYVQIVNLGTEMLPNEKISPSMSSVLSKELEIGYKYLEGFILFSL